MKKKIIFLPVSIDVNSASFNRFYTIVKMMHRANYLTSIICVQPLRTDKIENDIIVEGNILTYEELTYNNIHVYSGKKFLFQKVFLLLKVYNNALRLINKESKKHQIVLYLNSNELRDYLFFAVIAKIYNLKFVKEFSEYPAQIRNPKRFKTAFYNNFMRPWRNKFFDGLIIMTQSLIDFHTRNKGKNAKIVKIPMTVDPSRFENRNIENSKYLGYVGGLNCKKDGLDVLIKGFALISDDFPDYDLKIAGFSYDKGEIEFLENLVKELNISNRVFFVGTLSRVEIPDFLLAASMLILARPESKQAEGGFPTKLGEYLMTGKPVIVTNVGEIHSYLEDGKTAYIIKPGDVNQLAEAIKIILTEPNKAKLVGINGKNAAKKFFDYSNYANRIQDFIESLY